MANNTWQGASGLWNNGSLWSTGAVPSSTNTVLINQPGTGAYTVTENITTTVAGLTVGNGNATLSIGGVTLMVAGLTTLSAGTISFTSGPGTLATGTFSEIGGSFNLSRNDTLDATGSGGRFSISAGRFRQSGGSVTATNGASFTGGTDAISGGSFNAGSLTVSGSSTLLTLSGGTVTTTTNSPIANILDVGDSINMSGTAVLDFTHGGANPTAGLLDNGNLIGSGTVSGVLSGSGTIQASGGTLDLTSSIAPASGLEFDIVGSATTALQVDGTIGTGNTFNFLGTSGEFVYNNAAPLSATVDALNVGSGATTPTNFINFEKSAVSVVGDNAFTGDSATVSLSDGSTLTLTDVNNTSGPWFVDTISNGTGGTELFLSDTVCYAAGTRILTPMGEKAVEHLSPGDLVITCRGEEFSAQPVRWIGQRRINLAAHPRPETVAPIRIRRGAFADNVPHNDLLVSPCHAVCVDGMLISARQLVNSTTIRQERDWKAVHYFHVELDAHAILLAEGLPAESYLDTGNRGFFVNTGKPLVLHPDLTSEADYPTREAGSCLPFVWDEDRVRPVWQRLSDRAAALGQAAPAPETTTDTHLRLVVDGRTVRPLSGENGCYTFILPKDAADVRLVSSAGSPTDVRPWLDDCRRLGVYVQRIKLHDAYDDLWDIPVDHPGLSEGWWAVERSGVELRRWTNGDAVLPLPPVDGTKILEIHASNGGMIYVSRATARRDGPTLWRAAS